MSKKKNKKPVESPATEEKVITGTQVQNDYKQRLKAFIDEVNASLAKYQIGINAVIHTHPNGALEPRIAYSDIKKYETSNS